MVIYSVRRRVMHVAILSVRPSVCQMRVLWKNSMMHYRYFDITRKGNHSSFLTRTVVSAWRPFPCEIFAKSDPPLLWKMPNLTDFLLITSQWLTVRDSEKSSITMNRKSTMSFPTRTFQRAIDGVSMLPLSPEMAGSKSIFSLLVNFSRMKSATRFLYVKTSSSKVVVQPFPYLMVHRY